MFKKGILIIFTIFLLLIGINEVDAASISISSDKSSVIVGNTVTFTVTINGSGNIGQAYGTVSASSNLTLLSGSSGTSINYFNGNNEKIKSLTYTYKYKANATGTATLMVSGVEVGNLETGTFETASTKSKSVTIVKKTSTSTGSNSSGSTSSGGTTTDKKTYSSDNTLSSLSIEGYNLTPEFNKDTTEYKLTVDQNVEKIKVNAKKNHDKASISGDGEVNLSLGENTISVKVTAENGNEKIYKIIVTVADLTPIKVNIDKKEFTIVKKNNDLIKKLDHYEEEIIKINEQDVVAYTNKNTNVTLVILKDSDNQLGYYIYNQKENTYQEYDTITVNGITLQLLDSVEKLKYYKKYSLELQEKKINFYKLKKNHKVGLIYGTNVKTGNTSYYIYDQNEETLSKYYDDEVKLYKEEIQKLKSYLMIFMGIASFVTILTIIISISNSKKKKILKNYK